MTPSVGVSRVGVVDGETGRGGWVGRGLMRAAIYAIRDKRLIDETLPKSVLLRWKKISNAWSPLPKNHPRGMEYGTIRGRRRRTWLAL